MLKHIKSINETIREILYNIEIDYLNNPVGEDFDSEVFIFMITDQKRLFFSYKIRITDRVIASVSYGLNTVDKRVNLGLEETCRLIANGITNDQILTFTTNGWLMDIPTNPLIKHSSYYK